MNYSFLDSIAILHGTDKASIHPVKGHDYCQVYEKFFDPLSDQPLKFLEIGVGGGESIKTWLDYFPSAFVFGVDNVRDTNEWNTVGKKPNARYHFTYGDQSDPTFWKCFAVDCGTNWGIIVDDGGHCNDQIITSFNGLWPHLKSGGLYCIEDLGAAYGSGSVFVKPGFHQHIDWIKERIDQINTGEGIEFMHVTKELVIFKKS